MIVEKSLHAGRKVPGYNFWHTWQLQVSFYWLPDYKRLSLVAYLSRRPFMFLRLIRDRAGRVVRLNLFPTPWWSRRLPWPKVGS
jgi:hypothetical protein